ncbi:MAG: heme ABC transporter ATP-binding protein [Hyphomicrobiales bacterium]|nr:MAG: heme ABC transporter ATP-binding protein [Hyphomicrobiales bacterium]
MLEAQNISLILNNKKLIDNVSLKVAHGELLAIIGPNGAGKTCLIKLLSGDLEASEGRVKLFGKALTDYSIKQLAQTRSVMPQSSDLNFPFNASQVVLFGRNPHLDKKGESLADLEIVKSALADTEMLGFSQRNYLTLSGGEKARVNLARVLAQRAPLVFLDEPISHVDPRHQHGILRLAKALANGGASVIVVLHDLNLAAAYADKIAIMHQAKLRAIGTPDEVLSESLLEEVFQIGFKRHDYPELNHPFLMILPKHTHAEPSYMTGYSG